MQNSLDDNKLSIGSWEDSYICHETSPLSNTKMPEIQPIAKFMKSNFTHNMTHPQTPWKIQMRVRKWKWRKELGYVP
jgi:hypothetical protein